MHEHTVSGTISGDTRSLSLALFITVLMMAAEFIGGILSGSLALISDAGHMLTDTGALTLSLLATLFSRQPSTSRNTFGFYRLEILSALLNGAILFMLSGYVFYQAALRFFHPKPVEGMLMLVVAVIGLVANIASAFLLSRGSGRSLNVKGALLHVISDAMTSVGVILGGLIIVFFGFYVIDPILGCVIGAFILVGAVRLIGESVGILLEATPSDIDIAKIVRSLKDETKGINDIHDVHVWTITTGLRSLSAHVLVNDKKVSECGEISSRIKKVLSERFSISHVTLEFECENCNEGVACSLKHSRSDILQIYFL